ncbi:MAG: L-2-amino-thiazoline-4-carboxylic acid hydrolase [Clostridiales bacterium]|nr:L-2-amino-thiazoline-4-carboxylic acid hydrolase [Clostridiales bacterium]MDO4351374.1 L-2-amino-thiazoline-4-carboxylic acid hydrolase [Eubacteriales bacterium]MDY4008688.1 L-2-amino-thiazoline-4-carboxylic acid hydrolase [Candidatus Limiplasma sp.]
MKYTLCEALMWRALTPDMFRWLKEHRPGWNVRALKRKAKKAYREMAARTPDIGSLRQNSLRICLSGGMVWLSTYEAAEGAMDEECFAGMVLASMESPLVKGAFQKKELFTAEAQRRRAESAQRGNASSHSPFNWKTEVVPGRDPDECTIFYRQCGLCALGRQEGLLALVPQMCVLDVLSVEWMGGVLYRSKTLATGGDCCDFYVCRKGSKWHAEREGRAWAQTPPS